MSVTWPEWEASIRALLDAGQVGDALRTIERALDEGQDAGTLLLLLDRAEQAGAVPQPGGLRTRLRLLGNAERSAEIEQRARAALAGGNTSAFLHAYLAWALGQREAYPEALAAAEAALRDGAALTPRERSLAWRMKGVALNRLDPASAWDTAFREALHGAEGWSRALILLDLGGLHSRRGDEASAMLAFSEALPLVTQPGHRAWLLNNMGLICLRAGRFAEAETYFGQVARLKSTFRSRALSGQAAVRRALGEWARAGTLYEQAAKAATDEDDLRQALRGQGHTQRLAGQPLRALDTLQRAARATEADRSSGTSWVNVDLAAALVSLPAPDAAQVRATLARTGPLDREDAERAAIVRAELARREGRPEEARAALVGLDRSTLWVREEAHAFPLLFGLLPPEARSEALPRPQRTEVRLRVLGLPEVQVGGRAVRLSALEVTLLTALVDAGGELTTDELTWVLRDQRPRDLRTAAKRVSRVAGELRAALGWDASVQALSGRYRLDPEAHWSSDLDDARQAGTAVEAFLSGVALPWATQREQELRQAD